MQTKLGKADYPEAVLITGLSLPTLRRMVSEGRIPYYKIGRRVFFDVQELTDYIESKRVNPTGGVAARA